MNPEDREIKMALEKLIRGKEKKAMPGENATESIQTKLL